MESSTKPQTRNLPAEKHVVRITNSGSINSYVAYAERQLLDPAVARVELRAVAAAIVKAVSVAEIIKRNTPGLRQQTTLCEAPASEQSGGAENTSAHKPSRSRVVSSLTITLARQGDTAKADP